jgi:hypothetical protein
VPIHCPRVHVTTVFNTYSNTVSHLSFRARCAEQHKPASTPHIFRDTALRRRHITSYSSLPHRTTATTLPHPPTMTSYAYLEELRMRTHGPRYVMCNAMRVHRRFIWVIFASISLLSARHLLVEQNIHFPLQLYFNQLGVAGLIALWPCFRWQDTQKLFHGWSRPWRPMTRGTILIIASMCISSLSTICTLQAILHFHNLPTLIMMTVR